MPGTGWPRPTTAQTLAVPVAETVDVDQARRDWSEAVELTRVLPHRTPDRRQVDVFTSSLREYAEHLVPLAEAVIGVEREDTDRETMRWLLARVRTTLEQGPGRDDRTAAVHLEDLALVCRALTNLHDVMSEGGAWS